MVRRVFFSFHYERDIWRANQVRNSWVTKPDREAAGFLDAAGWEQVRGRGEDAICRWIDSQLEDTSVTAVLIGTETSERRYVLYEIEQSHKRGKGLLGIYIHNLKDNQGQIDNKGQNPFGKLYIDRVYLSDIYLTYDWINDDGYNNFAEWVEKAAQKAGR